MSFALTIGKIAFSGECGPTAPASSSWSMPRYEGP